MKFLTFSTGNLYKKIDGLDIDSIIGFLKPLNLDIDGFMISFPNSYDFSRIKLSDKTADYLSNMNYNSIHAPNIDYNDTEKTKKLIKDMEEIYNKINAKHIIFHPYRIKNFFILKKMKMKFLFEFMRPHKNLCMDYYEKILNENPNAGFAHDICHAAQFSNSTIKDVFEKFKSRIEQVHISFADKETNHRPMYTATKEFLDAAECVKQLDVEFCMEAIMDDPKLIKKEVKFCREWLKN